jgi:hypothetical protein
MIAATRIEAVTSVGGDGESFEVSRVHRRILLEVVKPPKRLEHLLPPRGKVPVELRPELDVVSSWVPFGPTVRTHLGHHVRVEFTPGPAGEFAWTVLSRSLAYAARWDNPCRDASSFRLGFIDAAVGELGWDNHVFDTGAR